MNKGSSLWRWKNYFIIGLIICEVAYFGIASYHKILGKIYCIKTICFVPAKLKVHLVTHLAGVIEPDNTLNSTQKTYFDRAYPIYSVCGVLNYR
uniref:Putative ovule protein n=1 Tax=Solanum chacoense TaxID=4108 RepID=A0A0V0GUS7_SOLCH